ncbi:29628_t:CDS:2, partial [Racocetra persica]
LMDVLNAEENININANANIAQVASNNNNTPKIKINDDTTKIHYAATGFEEAALHYLPATQLSTLPLSTIKKKLRQTRSVQKYGTQFHNIIGQIENMNEIDKALATLEKAWVLAIRFDTVMFETGKPTTNKTQQYFYIQKTIRGNGGPILIELDYTRGSNQKYKKNGQKGNCLKCSQLGHYAKNCKNKNKTKLTNIEEEPNQLSQAITNNSLELMQVEENQEQLLRFNSKINSYDVWILLDGEASRNFIDESFVSRNKFITITSSFLLVELADGRKTTTNKTIDIT